MNDKDESITILPEGEYRAVMESVYLRRSPMTRAAFITIGYRLNNGRLSFQTAACSAKWSLMTSKAIGMPFERIMSLSNPIDIASAIVKWADKKEFIITVRHRLHVIENENVIFAQVHRAKQLEKEAV